ncbi:hypothetical protein Glove_256g148 [Diversispora epigaea]|uniref:Uncharacterized protein n=1 Tax=Diversispora epigaea TaxID=1348612 RepID=A0A397IEV7_9GLOM|nr:hypothetical protein Glove_256g148 [Diversispora epigaea]
MSNMKNNNKTAVSTNKRDGRGNRSGRGGGGSRGGKGDNGRTKATEINIKSSIMETFSENEKENILSQSSDELGKRIKKGTFRKLRGESKIKLEENEENFERELKELEEKMEEINEMKKHKKLKKTLSITVTVLNEVKDDILSINTNILEHDLRKISEACNKAATEWVYE